MCSDDQAAELARRLGQRWNADVQHFELRCAGGRFPEVGFFVEVRWSTVRRVGVIDVEGDREIIPFVDLAADRADRWIVRTLFAEDLDGNGIDEVIDAWRHEENGTSGDRLILWTTNGTELARSDGPNLNAFRPGLGACHATLEVAEDAVIITVRTAHGLSPTACLPTGRHRFVMRMGRLTQLDSPEHPPEPPASTFSGKFG